MIEQNHPRLSVGAQCRLLSISRSSPYYAPQGETAMNLDLMLKVDKQFPETPFYGVQQMTWNLQNEGHTVNGKRIRRLMRLMRLMPIRCPAGFCAANAERVTKTQHQLPGNTCLHVCEGASPRRGTRPTPICWAGCGSTGQIRSGAGTSPTFRCAKASCIWSLSWTVHPQGSGLAHLQHAGGGLLP